MEMEIFLPPRMTTTQQNAIATPAEGLNVYDNVLHLPAFYNGTSWLNLATTTSSGSLIISQSIFTNQNTSSLASTRVAALEYWRGNVAGSGGFHYICRFGPATLYIETDN